MKCLKVILHRSEETESLSSQLMPTRLHGMSRILVKTAEGTKDYTAEELGSNVFVVDKVASDIDVVAHFAKQELKSVITFEANDAALGAGAAVWTGREG